jgi:tRNA (Thr-GGU) A37 N-methylase
MDHHVEDLHAVDGTPLIDIKPWFTAMGPRGEIREPQWDPVPAENAIRPGQGELVGTWATDHGWFGLSPDRSVSVNTG